jgi:hypothetical protein
MLTITPPIQLYCHWRSNCEFTVHKNCTEQYHDSKDRYPRVPIIRTHNNVHVKKSFQNCFLLNQIHFSIKQIFAF